MRSSLAPFLASYLISNSGRWLRIVDLRNACVRICLSVCWMHSCGGTRVSSPSCCASDSSWYCAQNNKNLQKHTTCSHHYRSLTCREWTSLRPRSSTPCPLRWKLSSASLASSSVRVRCMSSRHSKECTGDWRFAFACCATLPVAHPDYDSSWTDASR